MRRRDAGSEASELWFFDDRPIQEAEQDRLNYRSVARVLSNAIESAKPPCMIGLLAEFGRGKSSTTNIAAEMLQAKGEYDIVTVTADKHSGNARARNLVHGIAAQLERLPRIDRKDVFEILRPLRQSTQVLAVDPTDTPWQRVMSKRYSKKHLAVALVPSAVLLPFLVRLVFLADGWVANASSVGSGLLLLWLLWLLRLFRALDAPVRALGEPAKVTDQTPRAEAADDIEEVFGVLIGHHHKRRKRQLVVIIDDIDRLSKDDLLDALRVLRSLQSVPRGQEPVFVISCNESILAAAVGAARAAPAPLPFVVSPEDGDSQPAFGQQPSEEHSGHADGHDDPALAFIDKILTVRVRMPPPIRGDMRRFAHDRIDATHPLRGEDRINLDDLIPVLIHDRVEDPRAVVRLLNGFVGSYLLGHTREQEGTVFLGDITHHPDVVAQLCVLADEFAGFYVEVLAEPVLLVAARKVALHQSSLSPSETAALEASSGFERDDDGELAFVNAELRLYLSSTARRVDYPANLNTLVYMTATPAGRALGQQMHSELRSGVVSGDHEVLADVLARVPPDKIAAAGQEISYMLQEAAPADASTYLAAVVPTLPTFESTAAQDMADSCVELLDRATDVQVPAACLTEILDYAAADHDEALCNRLLVSGEDAEEDNERHAHAARYLSGNPRIRDHVESAVVAWLAELPDTGSWDLGLEWLEVAESLDPIDYSDLRRAAVTAMSRCIRSEKNFTEQHGDRLVALATATVRDHADAAPDSTDLVDTGPNTRAAFVRIWGITGHQGSADDSEYAAEVAADPDVPTAARRVAAERVAAWARVWESAQLLQEGAEDPEDLYDVRTSIVPSLVAAAQDPEVLAAVSDGLPAILEQLAGDETADALLDGIVAEAEGLLAEGDVNGAGHALRRVVEAAGHDWDLLDGKARHLLDPIGSQNDPADPEVATALALVPAVAYTDDGPQVLSSIAAEWRDHLRRSGQHDGRAVAEGFKALPEDLSEIVEENAQLVLQDLRGHIERQDDPANRLHTIATFPWPAELRPEAAETLDAHWDDVADDTMLHALDLCTRTELDADAEARFQDRLVAATQVDPFGSVTRVAVAMMQSMSARNRAAVYIAAVGRHSDATQAWIDAEELERAEAIADFTADASTAKRLLESLPQAHRAATSRATLIKITTTSDVATEVVATAASYAEREGLEAAVQAAVSELQEDAPALVSTLSVLHEVRTYAVRPDTRKVTSAAVAHLPEATPAAGELFGQLIEVRTLGRTLQGVLKEMDHGSERARATSEAFRAARSRRKRR